MTRWGKRKASAAQPTPPSAGWFADPVNPSRMRWWDGRGWTEHYAPMDDPQTPQATTSAIAMRTAQTASPEVAMPPATAAHAPSPTMDEDPSDILRRMWGQMEFTDIRRWPLDEQIEVAGEQFYAKEIRKQFGECGIPITSTRSTVEDEPCFLVPGPWNPHDANAVAVLVRTYQVGHIPAELAKRYHPVLIKYAQNRLLVTGGARVWAKTDGLFVRARATIAVPGAAALAG